MTFHGDQTFRQRMDGRIVELSDCWRSFLRLSEFIFAICPFAVAVPQIRVVKQGGLAPPHRQGSGGRGSGIVSFAGLAVPTTKGTAGSGSGTANFPGRAGCWLAGRLNANI